eukprot:SAG31_NODE_5050_length_2775_cov_2.843423_4_plen_100_part_00
MLMSVAGGYSAERGEEEEEQSGTPYRLHTQLLKSGVASADLSESDQGTTVTERRAAGRSTALHCLYTVQGTARALPPAVTASDPRAVARACCLLTLQTS